ncbi:MAG: PrsW family glutamic-type intramembrane protease [Candidatus Saccharibacteria bacterium]|nr:PrsW family glutamic-type intramembrane protease [Candidatus Saccharibacteria bacterium]
MIYIIVLLAALPVLGVLYYVNKKDLEKEPRSLLRKIFIYGCLSSVSVLFLEMFMDYFVPVDGVTNPGQMFTNVFLGIALIEEGMKLSGVMLLAMKNVEFDCRYDAIVYCVYSSLGFAFVENFLYVMSSTVSGGVLTTVIGRAIFSIPGHAMFGVIMGYFIGKAKEAKIKKSVGYSGNVVLALVMPMLVHTIYDWALMMSTASGYLGNSANSVLYIALFILSFIFAISIALVLINRTSQIKTDFYGKNILEEVNFVQSTVVTYGAVPTVNTPAVSPVPVVAKPVDLPPVLSATPIETTPANTTSASLATITPINAAPLTAEPQNTEAPKTDINPTVV